MKKDNFNQDKIAIIKLLDKMQAGYTKRAVDKVDEYCKELFVPGDAMIILGTSDGEWCLGYDQSKSLLEGDWKYWGNVVIDTQNINISFSNDVAWFNTQGSVEYSFGSNDETFDRFVGFVKEYLGEECWLGKLSNQSKLTTISWLLSHMNLDQIPGERRYQWQIRLSGVAIKGEDGWKFTQMQFSLPTTSIYPDERIWEDNCYQKGHQAAYQKLREFISQKRNNTPSEIISRLEEFNRDYLNSDMLSSQLVNRYFSNTGEETLVGTGTDKYLGLEELIKAVNLHRSQWQQLTLGFQDAIISIHNNTAWLLSQGEAKTVITQQQAIEHELEIANQIVDSKMPSREKLYKIRRNIQAMMNEMAKGESFEWPIRFEGVMVKEEGEWRFRYIQMSYPFNMILEGKTDAAVRIDM